MNQAMGAVALLKGEEAGAIDRDHKVTLESAGVQHPVPHEPTHAGGAQLGDRRRTDVTQVMTQGLIDRQGGLLRTGQAVDVGQATEIQIAELEIELAPAPQFQDKEEQSPPDEKSAPVFDQELPARIREGIQPEVELWPEMSNGLDEAPPQSQDLPARRRLAVV